MNSKSIRLIKHSLVLPVVLAGTTLGSSVFSQAFAQSMPLINVPNVDVDAGVPPAAPGGRTITMVPGPGVGPNQGNGRSLLPAAERSEFSSFNPDPGKGLVREVNSDADSGPSIVTPKPAVSAEPVTIPVPPAGEPVVSAPVAVLEPRPVPRRRERTVIPVAMDQALVVRSPENVRTMILGNPMIADVAPQKGGLIVVTGKMYGSTNLVLVDAKGAILGEAIIQVQQPKVDVVTVQLGLARQSYSCTPQCQPTMVVGNEQGWFSSTTGQAQQRNSGMKSGQ